MAARCLMTSVGESSCLAPKNGVLKQLGAEILKVSRWTLGIEVMSTFLLTRKPGATAFTNFEEARILKFVAKTATSE